MNRIIVLVVGFVLAAGGCSFPPNAPSSAEPGTAGTVSFWHDDDRHVGCWIYTAFYKGGISCLPDGQYTP